jgi:16S rRNA (guanine(527)-N(7))-methyltransferase RsmG
MFHVKHLLLQTLKELNIDSSPNKNSLLLQYLEELTKWNKKINIISRKLSEEDIVKKLILPSLIPINIVEDKSKVLDFGAGGGIASIPLKIFKPGINLHLLESKKKPVVFLEHINALLNLKMNIKNKYVKKKEDLEEKYNWVFVRAVDPEKVPQGLADKTLYYGKYEGNNFRLQEEIEFKGNIISVLF